MANNIQPTGTTNPTDFTKSIPVSQAVIIGQRVVDMFGLKKNDINRYKSDWGEKTIEGLGRCVERIVREATK